MIILAIFVVVIFVRLLSCLYNLRQINITEFNGVIGLSLLSSVITEYANLWTYLDQSLHFLS